MCLREADYDSSISRAFYAVFHSLNALLDIEEEISHPELIRQAIQWNRSHTQLRRAGALDRRHTDLGDSLEGIRRWRTEADYDLEAGTIERAQNSARFAEQMLQVVKEVLL